MCLPSVKVINSSDIALHMGHKYYKGFYHVYENTIYVNEDYGLNFWNLLHEMGHWLICLLPLCDVTYDLNVFYDKIDRFINRK